MTDLVVWARLPGFPHWPSRFCTSHEKVVLENGKSKPNFKQPQVAVVFLGSTYLSGWVPEHSIKPFSKDTFQSYFCSKSYKKQKDYKNAIFEAIRIVDKNSEYFTVQMFGTLSSTSGDDISSLLSQSLDTCEVCNGTSYSGPYVTCTHCDTIYTHFHCFSPPIARFPQRAWYCKSCCQTLKVEYNTQLQEDEMIYTPHKPGESNKQPSSQLTSSATTTSSNTITAMQNKGKMTNSLFPTTSTIDDDDILFQDKKQIIGMTSASNTFANTSTNRLSIGNSSSSSASHTGKSNSLLTSHDLNKANNITTAVNSSSSATSSSSSSSSSSSQSVKNMLSTNTNTVISQMKNTLHFTESKDSSSSNLHKISHTGASSSSTTTTAISTQQQQQMLPTCIEDERCFICHEGGVLLICEFPNCPRVYHKMCIIRTANQYIEEDISHLFSSNTESSIRRHSLDHEKMITTTVGEKNEKMMMMSSVHSTILDREKDMIRNNKNDEDDDEDEDETWFCPAHNCMNCGAMQMNSYSLKTLNPSKQYLSMLKIDSNTGTYLKRQLKTCIICPTSLCMECETQVGLGMSLYKEKKFEDISHNTSKSSTKCLNCISTDPRLKLARILEGAWVRMTRSRLAIPFLTAILPGCHSSTPLSSSSSSSSSSLKWFMKENNNYNTQLSTQRVLDAYLQQIHTTVQSTISKNKKEFLNQLWNSYFSSLFQSVPLISSQLFQATFFYNTTYTYDDQYQELLTIDYNDNYDLLYTTLITLINQNITSSDSGSVSQSVPISIPTTSTTNTTTNTTTNLVHDCNNFDNSMKSIHPPHSSQMTAADTSYMMNSYKGPLCFLDILTKIRSLQYISIYDFLYDFIIIRYQLCCILQLQLNEDMTSPPVTLTTTSTSTCTSSDSENTTLIDINKITGSSAPITISAVNSVHSDTIYQSGRKRKCSDNHSHSTSIDDIISTSSSTQSSASVTMTIDHLDKDLKLPLVTSNNIAIHPTDSTNDAMEIEVEKDETLVSDDPLKGITYMKTHPPLIDMTVNSIERNELLSAYDTVMSVCLQHLLQHKMDIYHQQNLLHKNSDLYTKMSLNSIISTILLKDITNEDTPDITMEDIKNNTIDIADSLHTSKKLEDEECSEESIDLNSISDETNDNGINLPEVSKFKPSKGNENNYTDVNTSNKSVDIDVDVDESFTTKGSHVRSSTQTADESNLKLSTRNRGKGANNGSKTISTPTSTDLVDRSSIQQDLESKAISVPLNINKEDTLTPFLDSPSKRTRSLSGKATIDSLRKNDMTSVSNNSKDNTIHKTVTDDLMTMTSSSTDIHPFEDNNNNNNSGIRRRSSRLSSSTNTNTTKENDDKVINKSIMNNADTTVSTVNNTISIQGTIGNTGTTSNIVKDGIVLSKESRTPGMESSYPPLTSSTPQISGSNRAEVNHSTTGSDNAIYNNTNLKPNPRSTKLLASERQQIIHDYNLLSRKKKIIQDKICTQRFLYLWRISCDYRFIEYFHSSHTNSLISTKENVVSGITNKMPCPKDGGLSCSSYLYILPRSISKWISFVKQGAKGDVIQTRHTTKLQQLYNHQESREKAQNLLQYCDFEDQMSPESAAYCMLDLATDPLSTILYPSSTYSLQNETVTLLEGDYHSSTLSWNKVHKSVQKPSNPVNNVFHNNTNNIASINVNGKRFKPNSYDDLPPGHTSTAEMDENKDTDNDDLYNMTMNVADSYRLYNTPSSSYSRSYPGHLIQDETLLMLDRMKDLTTKTLHLQTKLRREYEQMKSQYMSYNTAAGDSICELPLSLGEGRVVYELKFANQQLKWKLHHQYKQLNTMELQNDKLKSQVQSLNIQSTHTQNELVMARKEIARLQNVITKKESVPSLTTTSHSRHPPATIGTTKSASTCNVATNRNERK